MGSWGPSSSGRSKLAENVDRSSLQTGFLAKNAPHSIVASFDSDDLLRSYVLFSWRAHHSTGPGYCGNGCVIQNSGIGLLRCLLVANRLDTRKVITPFLLRSLPIRIKDLSLIRSLAAVGNRLRLGQGQFAGSGASFD